MINTKFEKFIRQMLENIESDFREDAKGQRRKFYNKIAKIGIGHDRYVIELGLFDAKRMKSFFNKFMENLKKEIEKNPQNYRNYDFSIINSEFEKVLLRLFFNSKSHIEEKGTVGSIPQRIIESSIGKVQISYNDCISKLKNKLKEIKYNLDLVVNNNSAESTNKKTEEITKNKSLKDKPEQKEKLTKQSNETKNKITTWLKSHWKFLIYISCFVIFGVLSLLLPKRMILIHFLSDMTEDKNLKEYLEEKKIPSQEDRIVTLTYANSLSLTELIIYAQSGDRQAYERLKDMSKDSQDAKRVTTQIYEKFNYEAFTMIPFESEVTNESVIKFLSDDDFSERKKAIYTLGKRKMCKQIPTLISMIETESNLDVLAAIIRVLNDLLGTNVEVLQEDEYYQFKKAWQEQKNELLKN